MSDYDAAVSTLCNNPARASRLSKTRFPFSESLFGNDVAENLAV